jgi:hypothetical protein
MEPPASGTRWGRPSWTRLRWNRPALTALAGAALATFVWHSWVQGSALGSLSNDFDQLWFGARVLLAGGDPYAVVRPGGPQGTDFPLYYPLTAVLAAIPLAPLSLDAARWAFITLGAGLLGYVVGRHRPYLWPLFLGMPFLIAAESGQWSTYLTAAILVPALRITAVAKPNIGVAMLARLDPGEARDVLLKGGILVAVLLSLLVDVAWPSKWLHALGESDHFSPLVFRPGGFLLLLGLLRWRDPDARMLLALGLVPQTGLLYDALPAIVVARTRGEALGLAVLSHAAWYGGAFVNPETFADRSWSVGTLSLWGVLLPALGLVLWRWRTPRLEARPPAPAA